MFGERHKRRFRLLWSEPAKPNGVIENDKFAQEEGGEKGEGEGDLHIYMVPDSLASNIPHPSLLVVYSTILYTILDPSGTYGYQRVPTTFNVDKQE